MSRAGTFVLIVAAAVAQAGCDNQHVVGGLDGTGGTATGGMATGGMATGGTATGGTATGGMATGGSAAGTGGVGGVGGDLVAGVAGNGPGGAGGLMTQSWTGYVESYMFPSGSDAVHITFTPDATGQLMGTVTLGSGTPPPPATDPNVGYPSDLLSGVWSFDATLIGDVYIAEGSPYTMRDGTLSGGRLRCSAALFETWTGWCALQTPVPGYTTCLPGWSSMADTYYTTCSQQNPTTHQKVPVDCGKLALCSLGTDPVCVCDASSCAVRDAGTKVTFDLAVSGDSASGTVMGGRIDMHNVHLTRDP